MPPEIGIFTTTLYQLINAVLMGSLEVAGDMRTLFAFCVTAAWSLGIIFWIFAGSPRDVGGILKLLTLVFATGWVLEFLPYNWYSVMNDALSVGTTIYPEGGELDAMDPSSVFLFFWNIAEILLTRINDLVWDWKFLLNIPDLIVYVPAWACVVAAGAVFTIVIFISWLGVGVMMIPVIICAATAPFSPVAPLAAKGLGWFLGAVVRMVGFGALVGVMGLSVSTLQFAEGVVASKYQAIGVGVMCLIWLALAFVVHKTASQIGGGINLGEALGNMTKSSAAGGRAMLKAGAMAARGAAVAAGGAGMAVAATTAAVKGMTMQGTQGGGGGTSGTAWANTLQRVGLDPSGFSAEQGQTAAAAITSEARRRASEGSPNPISPATAQYIAEASNDRATPGQIGTLAAVGVDASGMTRWQASEEIRMAREAGKNPPMYAPEYTSKR